VVSDTEAGGGLVAKPPIHRGESAHSAKLTDDQVKAIKREIADGRALKEIAHDVGLGYMVIYKIATGETWSNGEGRMIARRARGLSPKKRDKMYMLKRRKGVSNTRLAEAARVSESTVARGMRDAHAVLAARAHRMLLTSGGHEAAMERYKLTRAEAEELVTYSATHALPKRLESEVDGG
jgi:hypothetical protein